MNYKLVIFDLDGTLIDTAEDVSSCLQSTLQESGYGYYSKDNIKSLLGLPFEDIVMNLIGKDLDEEEVSSLISDFRSKYNAFDKVNTRPFDGIGELLNELQNKNIHIGVNTNKQTSAAKDILNEMFPGIDLVISGHKNSISPKPSPDGANIIMHKTEVTSRSEVLYVGDTRVDMLTASSISCDFALVNWKKINCPLRDDHKVNYYCENIEQLRKIIIADE